MLFCWFNRTITFNMQWCSSQLSVYFTSRKSINPVSEAMDFPLWVGGELQLQMEDLEFVQVWFKWEKGGVGDLQGDHDLQVKANNLQVMTEMIKSQIQAAEMWFLCRVAWLSLTEFWGWSLIT